MSGSTQWLIAQSIPDDIFSPALESCGEASDHLRFALRDVAKLTGIRCKVVELECAIRSGSDQFEITMSHRGHARSRGPVFPKQGTVTSRRATGDNLRWIDAIKSAVSWNFRSRMSQDHGQDIHRNEWSIAVGVGRQSSRPPENRGDANATFPTIRTTSAKRSIGGETHPVLGAGVRTVVII